MGESPHRLRLLLPFRPLPHRPPWGAALPEKTEAALGALADPPHPRGGCTEGKRAGSFPSPWEQITTRSPRLPEVNSSEKQGVWTIRQPCSLVLDKQEVKLGRAWCRVQQIPETGVQNPGFFSSCISPPSWSLAIANQTRVPSRKG